MLLTIPFAIPAYWTPEQALAVVDLLEDLRDKVWSHYAAQLQEQYRELYRERSDSLALGRGPASPDDPDPDDRSF